MRIYFRDVFGIVWGVGVTIAYAYKVPSIYFGQVLNIALGAALLASTLAFIVVRWADS